MIISLRFIFDARGRGRLEKRPVDPVPMRVRCEGIILVPCQGPRNPANYRHHDTSLGVRAGNVGDKSLRSQ